MAALSRALILVALTVTIFSTVAVATEFIVGDDKGWTTHVNYQAWAADKVFRVGDKLVFNYPRGMDNVVMGNSTEFTECTAAPDAPALNSGHDWIIFGSTGLRFYISGFGDHCKLGQRLALSVLPDEEARPPVPSSSPPAPWSDPPFVPVPTAPAPSSHSHQAPPVAPFVPAPPAPAPWTDAPAPSPEPPCASWTTSFSHFARSVPRKLFKVFQ